MQKTFEGRAEVLFDVLHHVNLQSKNRKEVTPVSKFILQSIDEILEFRSHGAPLVCSRLSSALIVPSKRVNSSPVWTASTFYAFCRENEKVLEAVSPEVFHAIVSYLHDVGIILKVPKSDSDDEPWIVVDPNWFTQNFMGELISLGHDFYGRGGDGFVDEPYFQHLINSILRSKPNKGRNIERSILEDLLHGLDLCFKVKVDGSQKYFVPIIYGGLEEKCDMRRRVYELHWDDEHMEDCQYLGYRLQCEDSQRTSLNAAFFSQFQINFRQTLMEKLGIGAECVTCYLGFMKIRHDGHELFVESDEIAGQHVDILVRSSRVGVQVPREKCQIKCFLKNHVIHKLMAFCAKCCPGIKLGLSIIRTTTVMVLIPIHERKAPQHCVKVETLKQSFQKFIEQHIEDVEGDIDMDAILNFQHSWPTGGTEIARDVLYQRDMEDICNRVQSTLHEAEIHTDLMELRGILRKLTEASSQGALKVEESSGGEQMGFKWNKWNKCVIDLVLEFGGVSVGGGDSLEWVEEEHENTGCICTWENQILQCTKDVLTCEVPNENLTPVVISQ